MLQFRRRLKKFQKLQIIGGIFIAITVPAIFLLVYYTGGSKFAYAHTMYIPIILSGLLFGPWIGLIIGVVGGILLGPLMPLVISSGEAQLLINWLYRLLVFVIVGFLSGYASKSLRNSILKIQILSSHNQETNIPNTNYLTYIKEEDKPSRKTVVTVLVNNHNNIIDVLGEGIYHKLLYMLYEDLKKNLESNTIIVQSDSNKFWLVTDMEGTEKTAGKIVEIITRPKVINNIPLYVEYSVGISEEFNYHALDSLTAFTSSDICARQAHLKQFNYVVYDNIKQKKRFEYEILMSFNNAIKNNETYLVYQPKIDLKTMKPIGLEALMRWNNPHHGEIGPVVFIPLIEQTRLINELTNWVLKTAVKKIKEFYDNGIETVISINVSAKNLIDPLFFDRSMKIINDSGINKSLLEFELTESSIMANPEESKNVLTKFADKGIKIAIDDFGTGYSSLSYLSRFPVNTIKIDKFFMKEISTSESAQRIVKSTVLLAKELGYYVLTEGIEDQEAAEIVKEFNCDFAQGYYFAQPIKSEDIFAWYEEKLKE